MNKMTKAELVRAMIYGAKAQGQTADALIGAVMEQFGFARQLARTYIKNNWNKVVFEQVVVEAVVEAAKPARTLSMTKDAIRKRELRAAKKAAVVAA